MNHFIALQRKADGRWDYTWNGHAYGYCSAWREWDDVTKQMHPAQYENALKHKDKYHTDGHESAEAAGACYKEFLLDHEVGYHRKITNAQHKCEVCGEWTQLYAQVGGYDMHFLCEQHQTREALAGLVKVGESWES